MSLFDCIQRAMDDDGEDGVKASRARGERAQALWREKSDAYERAGHPRHTAETLAAKDVTESFKREAGEKRHVYLSVAAAQRKAQAIVSSRDKPNMVRRMEELDLKHRAITRRFQGRLGAYLEQHHRKISGEVTNPAQLAEIADEIHGKASGNPTAQGLASGVMNALEDLRLMFNEAGGLINKLENWGVPHVHDRLAIMRAGFDAWSAKIDAHLDWAKIIDPLTGKVIQPDPMTGQPSAAMKNSYLRSAYDNIVFGKDADDVVYGRPKGVATYRKHADQRHLHFRDGKSWMEYNRDFGSGGLHEAIMGHVHRMARDIVLMREFGPNPKLGAEYEADLWRAKAKAAGDEEILGGLTSDTGTAMRMLNVMSGGNVTQEPWMLWSSAFFSTGRSLLQSAFLDRAIVASVSDMNTMRMAAKSFGMNQNSLIKRQLGMVQGLTREEQLRAGWVADTLADAGTAMARFENEVAPRAWAERVTQASMRIQGLSWWTDRARFAAYSEFSGFMAGQGDRMFADVEAPLRTAFEKWGVTASDWDEFRRPENLFTAGNGATYAMPLHFRNVTALDKAKAEDLFFKMQGVTEEFMELAVPTKSLLALSFVDPSAANLPPGHPLYEMAKSATMMKSFPMTFTINQYRQIKARGGLLSKSGALYSLDLVAGATVMGALALQVGDLLMGRDPQDMTQPEFWARSAAKGGGLGILGDIVTTGSASWGGGYSSYIAGPVPQAAQDVFGLTAHNAWQAVTGQDANFAAELSRFGKRYTPMGQTPIIGPAMDRLLWDQLQLFLDPESVDALTATSNKRKKDTGAGEYWLPGSPLPNRLPDLGAAIGQAR